MNTINDYLRIDLDAEFINNLADLNLSGTSNTIVNYEKKISEFLKKFLISGCLVGCLLANYSQAAELEPGPERKVSPPTAYLSPASPPAAGELAAISASIASTSRSGATLSSPASMAPVISVGVETATPTPRPTFSVIESIRDGERDGKGLASSPTLASSGTGLADVKSAADGVLVAKVKQFKYWIQEKQREEMVRRSLILQWVNRQFLEERIYATSEINSISWILQHPDKDLAVFDVDDTLIGGLDPYFHAHFVPDTPLNQKLFTSGDEDTLDRYFYGLMPTRLWTLLEPETPKRISDLQASGIKVMALTSLRPIIKDRLNIDIPSWRVKHLQMFGYDFSKDFPIPSFWGWDKLNSQDGMKPFKRGDGRQHYFIRGSVSEPYFKQGVMLSGRVPKPRAFLSFLRIISFRPKSVVFVDDNFDNVCSFYQELTRVGIKCYSILYTRTHKYPIRNMVSKEAYDSCLQKQEEFLRKLL